MSIQDAKKIVDKLEKDKRGNFHLTTNQIRKFLAGVNGVHNRIMAYQAEGKITNDILPQDIIDDIQYVKVKLIYQSGRERAVKDFIQIGDIEARIDEIGNSKQKFKEFNRFIEGIVAYHKYQGGK